ncbi:CHAT domain-containing protein, partial [Mycena vulgaris]
IARMQQLVKKKPQGHPDLPEHHYSLGIAFGTRYRTSGNFDDLNAAVQTFQIAVNLISRGNPRRATYLQDLGVSLSDRYRGLGDLQDFNAALQNVQEAADLTPDGDPDRSTRLRNLAALFWDRYKRCGDLRDLDVVLQNDQEAAKLTPQGHPDRVNTLHGLAVACAECYQRLGDPQNLDAALHNYQEGLDLTPHGHPDRVAYMQGLAASFTDRYHRLGDVRDLDAALQMKKDAVDLTPKRHPSRGRYLESLGLSFRDRSRRLADLQDLDAALEMQTEAVRLTPVGHPDRARCLHTLAISFLDRFGRLGDLKDLDVNRKTVQEALDLMPKEHPNRAQALRLLADSFHQRYKLLSDPEDLKAVHTHYSQSSQITTTATPDQSWHGGLRWASIAEQSDPSYCDTAYTAAFQLLPEILWIGHSITVRHEAIHRLQISQAMAKAAKTLLSLSNPTSTVRIMEQGLATTFQQVLQLKADVDKLKPGHAQKFQTLSSQLYSGTCSNPMSVVSDRNNLLEDIRKEPGLEYFLLPRSYSALCKASQGGPVVILNSHKISCDGIIIPNPTSSPVHVVLPDITLELLESQRTMLQELLGHCNVRSRGESPSSRLFGHKELFLSKTSEECFKDLLAFLWTHIVGPVYQALESVSTSSSPSFLGIHNGRIWWLPTGAFTGLPLHACPPTDQFIHSYTSTLASLIDANAKRPSSTAQKFSVVGVTHSGPARMNYLRGVEQEVKKIQSIVKNSPVECLEGQQATVDAVKLQLQDCCWMHLACHARQDLINPTKSHLQLYGGILELETILRMPLSNAQVVFLAACQTAMGDAALVNESFHLGGGFIAAGFRGAIGTLWSMNDLDGPLVAEIVYSHLFRDGRQPQASDAAEALHLAVKELKRRKIPCERWIPFIHMG